MNIKTTIFLAVVLLFLAAGFAQGQQYSYTFNAPAGAITCANAKPYQEWYQNLVENSTPPYPGALQPNNFHMPAFPNHPMPLPVGNGGCPRMTGFVGAETGVDMHIVFGGVAGWLYINHGTQGVQFDSGVWNVPSPYPSVGQATTFTFVANITQVCNAICQPASGQLNISGDWAFQWAQHQVFRWNYVQKDWTNVDVVQVQGLSTVAILD